MKQLSTQQTIVMGLALGIFLIEILLYLRYRSFGNPDYPLYYLIGWALLGVSIGYPRMYSKLPKADLIAIFCSSIALAIMAFHFGRTW